MQIFLHTTAENMTLSLFQTQAWISTKPVLFLPYLAHYAQSLLHVLVKQRAPGFIEAATGKKGY